MKARILVDVPEKGCRECRFTEKKGLMSACIVTGDTVTRNVVDERRPATCPMVSINQSETIRPTDVSLRTYNALKRAGYDTWAEVAEATEMELKRIRGLGMKGLKEIQERLNDCT